MWADLRLAIGPTGGWQSVGHRVGMPGQGIEIPYNNLGGLGPQQHWMKYTRLIGTFRRRLRGRDPHTTNEASLRPC